MFEAFKKCIDENEIYCENNYIILSNEKTFFFFKRVCQIR